MPTIFEQMIKEDRENVQLNPLFQKWGGGLNAESSEFLIEVSLIWGREREQLLSRRIFFFTPENKKRGRGSHLTYFILFIENNTDVKIKLK